MNRKTIILAAACMAAVFVPTITHAKTMPSYDNRFTLEVPENGWFETNDGMSQMAVTDTRNLVTVKEFAKGQAMYEPLTEYGDFAEICQVYYTTAEQVFMITGYITTAEDSEMVSSIVKSIQLADHQNIDPAPAEKKEKDTEESVSAERETEKPEAEKSKPTEEKKEEESRPAEEKKTEETDDSVKPTGQAWTVYDGNGGMLIIIEYTDGTVRDINGRIFQRDVYFNWVAEDGAYFYAQ